MSLSQILAQFVEMSFTLVSKLQTERYTALLSEKCLILFRTQILQIFLVFSHFFDLHCFHEFFETDEIELAELSKKPPVFNTTTWIEIEFF